MVSRINELIRLGQFENSRFYEEKFEDGELGLKMHEKIDAFEQFVFKGKPREAGIKLWKAGLVDDARAQFEISGDKSLIEFMDNLGGKKAESLDANIVTVFTEFDDNKDAQRLIVEVLKQDIEAMNKKHMIIKDEITQFKEKFYGKQ